MYQSLMSNNVISLGNNSKSQDMIIINNAMKQSNLQKTELMNAIIAAHRQYSKNPSTLNLVNSIIKKVPTSLLSSSEYNNMKNHINNSSDINTIMNCFNESALFYYGI